MDGRRRDGGQRAQGSKRRRLWIAVAVLAAVLVAGAGWLIYTGAWFGDSTPSAEGESAVVSDDVVVQILQKPSLSLVSQEGIWNVENDGNVTMSEIEVRDTAGAVICELGEMDPGDLKPCEDAGDRQDLVVAGEGPQGQKVEEPAPAG